MLLATLLLAFNWTTIMPLIEAVAVSGMRSAGLDYGRVRLWGSGSFILASFGAGLIIGQLGAASVMPMLVGATVLMIAGVYLLPRDVAERPSPATPAHRRISLADAVKLAHSPSFLLFLLAASAIQASHALYYTLRHAALARARLRRRNHRRALGARRRRRDRAVRRLRIDPRALGRAAHADGRRRRRSAPLGDHGLRPAALGDGDGAMPARHELRRGPSRRDLFPEQGRAGGPRRDRARRLCRRGRRSRSRARDHRQRAALSGARRRGLCGHGGAGAGRRGERGPA